MHHVDLFEGLATTRAIRRYTDAPVPETDLAKMLFGATRAPSGSNRQPFRFIVLRDSEIAREAKAIVGEAARSLWAHKRSRDGYDTGSGKQLDSPKTRMAASMEQYVANFERVPVLILPALLRHREPTPTEGASIYPACQNLLLAARALGYGGVLTSWQAVCENELKTLLNLPENATIAATITIGVPAGKHGPVRRRPLRELVYEDQWDQAPSWAIDPPGTEFTQAGPPKLSLNSRANPL